MSTTFKIELEHQGAFTTEQRHAIEADLRAVLEDAVKRLYTAPDSWEIRMDWSSPPAKPSQYPAAAGGGGEAASRPA